MLAKIKGFLTEITVELGRVSWPTKDELIGSTVLVIISTVIMTVLIGVCDFIFSTTIQVIIR